ncbi:hypothetical protein PT974_00544 [Cladobotryum mycophilum]|uniref:Uncharacterized protein n=1 Tax=Cladobotryum mycophilum TaxID=491253 RepID=A0ABR0T178_9HYPO
MGASPPFLYGAHQRDSRFPPTSFDPKAITRASWEPKARKPQPTGPLVSFNRHPDAHAALQPRTTQHTPLGRRTKAWIKWLRRLQLALRLLQLIGAAGILVLFSLFTRVDTPTTWAVRIMQAVTILHCFYATYHLSREAAGRTPASSAAYQFFAITVDLLATVAYVLGVFVVRGKANSWGTVLSDQSLMDYFIPAVYYGMMGTSGLHFITLSSSIWLGWMFRKISLMPPDMNPLEDHLTARPFHKRNKSSMSTSSTIVDGEKRPWTQGDSRRNSVQNSSRPSTVSFMDTRTQSRDSVDSKFAKVNLPNRQYQIIAGNSPRDSISSIKTKHRSLPESSHRGSYAEIPLAEADSTHPDPPPHGTNGGRAAKFTESWMPSDSLISRTNQRHQTMAGVDQGHRSRGSKSYSALTQPYNVDEYSSDSDSEETNGGNHFAADSDQFNSPHPNPLRSNPTSPDQNVGRAKRAIRPWDSARSLDYGFLSEISPGERHVSTSRDIADEELEFEPRQRDSSIQPEEFFAVSYGQVRSGTPPLLVGTSRKVSGNDFASKYSSIPYERRNVSGKIAEEGRAGGRYL